MYILIYPKVGRSKSQIEVIDAIDGDHCEKVRNGKLRVLRVSTNSYCELHSAGAEKLFLLTWKPLSRKTNTAFDCGRKFYQYSGENDE